MAGLVKMIIIGNVGTDPEMRFTANGNPITTFRIAASRTYTTPDGDRRDDTEWFTVVAWDRLAEQCSQYLQKGRRCYVEGRFQTRTWEGRDGQRRCQHELVANTVLFLDRMQTTPLTEGGEDALAPDDLPFE